MILECQSDLFNLDHNEIYLNGAYMSPMLQSTEKIGINGIMQKRIPSRISTEDFFVNVQNLKEAFAQLINITDSDRVVPIGSASYGLANAAYNVKIKKGQSICLIGDQFPSNYYIWDRLAKEQNASIITITAPDTLIKRGQKWNEKLLNAITSNVAVVAICYVHWADGTLFNLEAIRKKCDAVGAYLIIDGTQSIGALPFPQDLYMADAVICAGYKWMFGPYSIGAAYYGEKFDHGHPIEENWINRKNSNDFKNLVNYQDKYRSGAQRYAMGENSNFILLPMLVASINQVLEWKPVRFQNYCKSLVDEILQELRDHGYWIEEEEDRSNHLFGIKIPDNLDITDVQKSLLQKKISVSYRGNFIRVSPSVYNTKNDMQKFANCLSNLAE